MFRNGRRCERQCLRCRTISRPKRRASKSVRAVVGIGSSILQTHLRHGFFQEAVIKKRIANPIKIQVRQRSERQHADRLIFGYVGLLEPSKGVEHLLQAFRSLDPPNAELHLFGRGVTPEYEGRLRGQFESPQIRFQGFQPPEEIYSQIDIAVVPSLCDEAFGRVVPEANSQGIPVIVSDRGGLPEIVRDGVSGFVFSPSEKGSLEEKMQRFLDQPDLLTEMSGRCRDMAREYDAKGIAAEYLNLYRELVD